MISVFYHFGKQEYKVRKDKKMAIKFLRLSSDFGYGPAKANLIALLHSDIMSVSQIKFLTKLAEESYVYLVTEAVKGDAGAQHNLGSLIYLKYLKKDLDIKERYKEAIYWYQKAANQNHEPAKKSLEYTKALLESWG